MNVKKIIDLLFLPLEKTLKCIGSVLNQIPDKEELKNIKTSPKFKSTYPGQGEKHIHPTNDHDNKRDHKAKGPVHSENQIYNKPRK